MESQLPTKRSQDQLITDRLAASGLRVVLSATMLIVLGGCGNGDICSGGGTTAIQLSPNRRAVALVNDKLFEDILDWFELGDDRPSTSFDCLLDTFTATFDNDVDIVLAVMDISRDEFLTRSERRIISNFTVAQRIIESGIGAISGSPLGPVGPPSMRSYSLLGIKEGLLAGPSLHELAHGWCAYLNGPPALAAQIETEPLNHWGFSSVGGVLGGWEDGTLEQLSDDQFRACSPSIFEAFSPKGYANNNIPYAPLELYLMGLLPPDQVPDIQVAVNPILMELEGQCATFYADAIETVTIDDIISANGLRQPDVQLSQKHFRVGLIVIAEDPLTNSEWLEYEENLACLETNQECLELVTGISNEGLSTPFTPLTFYEATGERATLQFAVLFPSNPQLTVDQDGFLVPISTLSFEE